MENKLLINYVLFFIKPFQKIKLKKGGNILANLISSTNESDKDEGNFADALSTR